MSIWGFIFGYLSQRKVWEPWLLEELVELLRHLENHSLNFPYSSFYDFLKQVYTNPMSFIHLYYPGSGEFLQTIFGETDIIRFWLRQLWLPGMILGCSSGDGTLVRLSWQSETESSHGRSPWSQPGPLWLPGGNIMLTVSSNLNVLSLVMLLRSQVWGLESQSNVISPRCPALYWSNSVCRPPADNKCPSLSHCLTGWVSPNVIKHAILSRPLSLSLTQY